MCYVFFPKERVKLFVYMLCIYEYQGLSPGTTTPSKKKKKSRTNKLTPYQQKVKTKI